MDSERFADLCRALAEHPSRRGMGRALAGFALAGAFGRLSLAEVEAKRKKRKKKKTCKGGKKKCGKICIPETACCVDAECPVGTGLTCQNGSCACPAGEETCGGLCVDLETDGANCGACGFACETGECVHGVCTCLVQNDCPGSCPCADRLQGGRICFSGGNNGQACDDDDDCPARSACFSINLCSVPCSG